MLHAPATDTDKEEVDSFYNKVKFEIDRTWKQNMLLVIGDWNAKVGTMKKENVAELYGLGN